MSKIKALLMTSAGVIRTDIENDMETLQRAVGGYIECLQYMPEGFCLICNEEGKLHGLPPTCYVETGKYEGRILVGNILLVGINPTSTDFADVPEVLEQNWERYFTLIKGAK